MPRIPKPWYRSDRKSWFVTIQGTRHNLGTVKKAAFEKFYALMKEPTRPIVSMQSFVSVADAFLEWVHQNLEPLTYEWYRYRIERFCSHFPDLLLDELKPFHVQKWVDSYPDLRQNSRRNHMRAIKRCVKWASQQGYMDRDPLISLKMPGAQHREAFVRELEFETMCRYIKDPNFLLLCQITYQTGCRPQEIVKIEAKHFDPSYSRWVIPVSQAKGKKQPRIIYLSPLAVEETKQLAIRFPDGPIFRNSKGSPWNKNSIGCAFARLQVRMGKEAVGRQKKDIESLVIERFKLQVSSKKELKQLPERVRAKFRNAVYATFAPKYSLYVLRHSWATNALRSGLDALTVAVLMGHNDPSTLSKVYQHLAHDPAHMLAQAQRLSSVGKQS